MPELEVNSHLNLCLKNLKYRAPLTLIYTYCIFEQLFLVVTHISFNLCHGRFGFVFEALIVLKRQFYYKVNTYVRPYKKNGRG